VQRAKLIRQTNHKKKKNLLVTKSDARVGPSDVELRPLDCGSMCFMFCAYTTAEYLNRPALRLGEVGELKQADEKAGTHRGQTRTCFTEIGAALIASPQPIPDPNGGRI
jgi:hypothetical protein